MGGQSREKSLLLAPFILVPMVWNYILLSSAHYIDDIPAILLFTIGLTALAENRSFRFHIIFLIAMVNRETAVFLIPAMVLMQTGKKRLSALLLHSLVLFAAAFVIRLFLYKLISTGNSSSVSMFDTILKDNIHFLLSIFQGNPEALRMLMTFGGIWLLLPFCFGRVKPAVMRMTILLPLYFVGMLVVGNFNDEARIFNEMIPIVTVPAILFLGNHKA